MPRGPRIDIPGLIQHVICRGIERKTIFRSDADYEDLLSRILKLAGAEDLKVYAFALMPNHIHLLVRPLKTPLSTFMRRLLTGYAIYFNRKHRRAGHLFQNRYKSYVVEEDSYFFELIRYIHLNPVRAGIISELERLAVYPYTGYSALMGRANRPFLNSNEVLSHFSSNLRSARKKLFEFMQDGIAQGKRDDLSGGGLKRSLARLDPEQREDRQAFDERILGSSLFVESVLKETCKRQDLKERDSRLEELLGKVADIYNLTIPELCSGSKRAPVLKARTAVIFYATKDIGTSARELSKVLNVATATVHENIRLGKGKA